MNENMSDDLEDKRYRGRCIQALGGYYSTFGMPRANREPRTLGGYANKHDVYLSDVVDLMGELKVGVPSSKKSAQLFRAKLNSAAA